MAIEWVTTRYTAWSSIFEAGRVDSPRIENHLFDGVADHRLRHRGTGFGRQQQLAEDDTGSIWIELVSIQLRRFHSSDDR